MSDNSANKAITHWHSFIASKDPAVLQQLLDKDVTFHSPVVHSPQQGSMLTGMYLLAAAEIFNQSFHYNRQIIGDKDACLEFTVVIDEIEINGVDLIQWNADGKITDFKVMIRPLKGINMIHQKMAEKLQSMQP